MAAFQFKTREVALDFCGKVKFALPLDEVTRAKVRDAAQKAQQEAEELKAQNLAENEKVDALIDSMLDAVDDILGDGASEQIIAAKGSDVSVWDAMDLFKYVTDEIAAAFAATTDSYRQTVKPAAVPATAPVNRAQRRAHKRKNH